MSAEAAPSHPSPEDQSATWSSLLPLPLSDFEAFMRQEDRRSRPMAFFALVDAEGVLDRRAFQQAVADTLQRHRLLRCSIGRERGRPLWKDRPRPPIYIDWDDWEAPLRLPPTGEQFDLAEEVGVRIWVRRSVTHVRLYLQFHHVCCDGIGAYRMIGDLLCRYGELASKGEQEQSQAWGPLEPQRLLMRHCPEETNPTLFRRWAGMLGYGINVLGRPATMIVRRKQAAVPVRQPLPFGILAESLTAQESKQLRLAAVGMGATTNDVVVAATLRSLEQWDRRHRRQMPRRPYRIMMPLDLRDRGDETMPAANKCSYSMVETHAGQTDDWDGLIRQVREQTGSIKQQHRGRSFLNAIGLARPFPGFLPAMLAIPSCGATAVVTNVGDPTRRWTCDFARRGGRARFGDLAIDRFTGVPPLRPFNCAAVAAVTYRRIVTIGTRLDPNRYDEASTVEFHDLLIRNLRDFLQRFFETQPAADHSPGDDATPGQAGGDP